MEEVVKIKPIEMAKTVLIIFIRRIAKNILPDDVKAPIPDLGQTVRDLVKFFHSLLRIERNQILDLVLNIKKSLFYLLEAVPFKTSCLHSIAKETAGVESLLFDHRPQVCQLLHFLFKVLVVKTLIKM